jgi:hypothetical protein
MADLPLKLVAEDADDLAAISALVQDAVLKVGDFAWLPKARRFACVMNRYRWEAGRAGGRGERVRTGLHVEGVGKAQIARIRQDAPDAVLSLLALTFEGAPEGPGLVTLACAGGGAIRLSVDALEVHLNDLSQAWAAKARPQHDIG